MFIDGTVVKWFINTLDCESNSRNYIVTFWGHAEAFAITKCIDFLLAVNFKGIRILHVPVHVCIAASIASVI